MSKFTKQIARTYDFEGDVVAVRMNRLKRKDAIKLAPFMSEPNADGKVSMKFEDSLNFMDKACEILSKYVSSFSGLTNDEGAQISKEDILGEEGATYFMNLISLMISDLMQASFVGGEKEKKPLDAPQEDISKESVTIEHTSEESQ